LQYVKRQDTIFLMQTQPKTITALKILFWLKIILSALFVVYVIYLAAAQPQGGWTSGFNLGFLEGLTGQEDVVFFTSEDAGRASSQPLIAILLSFGMLYFLKKRKRNPLRGLVLFGIIWAIAGASSPLIDIIILILLFVPSVKAYFNTPSTSTS